MSEAQIFKCLEARVMVLEILLGEAVSSLPPAVRAEFRDKAQRLFTALPGTDSDYAAVTQESVATILNRIPAGGG